MLSSVRASMCCAHKHLLYRLRVEPNPVLSYREPLGGSDGVFELDDLVERDGPSPALLRPNQLDPVFVPALPGAVSHPEYLCSCCAAVFRLPRFEAAYPAAAPVAAPVQKPGRQDSELRDDEVVRGDDRGLV
jgi:hypothetical protein